MRIGITGGAGFIGSNLTTELIKNGYGSDMIGIDPESLVKIALKHAKQIYKSKEILDIMKDEDFL